MKPRNVVFSLLLVLGILAFAILRKWQEPQKQGLFNRHPGKLVFTAYSLCRMNCYAISREDVSDIIRKGVILLNKSNSRSRPCPVYALQGHTANGQYIRVIFEQCTGSTRVISCYFLKKEISCDCPIF
jgi:hypothetical protein